MMLQQLSRASRVKAITVSASKFSFTTVRCNSQQTHDDQLKVFRDNASKWWNGKEFVILRAMNEIRVPFIVDGIGKSLNETKILDVGCGGGILSEPLARLGANVLGIDPVFESINEAQLHAQIDPNLEGRLKYRSCNVDDLTSQAEHVEAFDGVIASEVLEHIEDVESFLVHCTKLLKPNGSLFITTINQTPLSWLGVIFLGEYVLQQLPKGTHTYDLFVNVKGLRVMLERLGYHIRLVNGFMYEPVSANFYWTPTTLTHYALQAIKMPQKLSAFGAQSSANSKNINYEQRRHFAAKTSSSAKKLSRPKVPLDAEEMMSVIPYDVYSSKSDNVISDLKHHLENNLTTRATITTLETLKITLPGLDDPLELRDVAQISMKGANLIVINCSTMPEAIKPILESINSLANLSPQVEVNNIFVPIPRVSREHRERLANTAKQAATAAKDKIRAVFSEYSTRAKRAANNRSGVSSDLVHNTVENLQFDMYKRLNEIDSLLKTRVDQILNQKN